MKKALGLLLLAVLMTAGCVEPVVMDPLEEMPVVVNCVLNMNRNEQFLDLYYAKRPSSSVADTIKEASVSVGAVVRYRDTTYKFEWNGKRWQSNFTPVPDTNYWLAVKTSDGKVLTASTRTPDRFQLITAEPSREDWDYGYLWSKAPDRDNFEKWKPYMYVRGYSFISLSSYSPYSVEVRAWITGGQRLSTDHPGADPVSIIPGEWSNLKSSPIFMDYPSQFAEYCNGLPLYGRFIRIHQQAGFRGNLTGEILGADQGRIPENAFFILSCDAHEGVQRYDHHGIPVSDDCFQAYFVSKEYDDYLCQMAQKNLIKKGEFAEMYSMDPIISNVKGGLGIFGAMCSDSADVGIQLLALFP